MGSRQATPVEVMPLAVALVTGSVLREPDLDQAPLVAALEREGAHVEVPAWDDPKVAWASFNVAVIRSTWNYHHHSEAFLAWVERAAAATRLYNPGEVVRWNAHKSYLLELAARGVPVVPTVLLARGKRAHLAELCSERGWCDVVVKPAVSAGSYQTLRARVPAAGQEHLERVLAERDALVQPYQSSVEAYGERSLVYIDGVITHAVRKTPRFLHDEEDVSAELPITDDERAVAAQALAAAPGPVLYGRVDLARDDHGQPHLMELELIEPSLFLLQHEPALQRFAHAIVQRARTVGLTARPPAPPQQ